MFQDRGHAGQDLVKEFKERFEMLKNPLVIALPRGGIPVGYEIAKALNMPMDIILVKKIGAPFDKELALGAITETGEVFFNENIASYYELTKEEEHRLSAEAKEKAIVQGKKLRENRPPLVVDNKSIILVDDGIATGATVNAVIKYLRHHKILKLVLAVPVCAEQAWEELKNLVDDFLVLDMPSPFLAVGRHYISFPQVTDEEAISYLRELQARKENSARITTINDFPHSQ